MKVRFLAREVIQTADMDCGPAALKCLLEGFGIHASYGRLREACQTDIDGTSIDTMEEVGRELGLDAEQVMVPLDHVLRENRLLPAIVVVRLPNGLTHFLVAWRKVGPFVQLMDPGVGRRWVTCRRFLAEVYLHEQAVPAEAWREWAGSGSTLRVFRRRLRDLGISGRSTLEKAAAAPGWEGLAAVDAAARAVQSMIRSGGIRGGHQAARVFERLKNQPDRIPPVYRSVREGEPGSLLMRGAVLVSVRGRLPETERGESPKSPELAAALREQPTRPGWQLAKLLAADGVLRPAVLAGTLLAASAGVLIEAVLLRGLFDLGRELGVAGQRFAAIAALGAFLLCLLLLDLPVASGFLKLGRRLETRLRLAFLEKIPRLGDRYFQSRVKSDMAERSHSIHGIRHLPELGGQLIRSFFELVLTTLGICWLDPGAAPLAVVTATLGICLPVAVQPAITERDLRVRSHMGALSRYYLDALLGLVPILTHGAERAVRREHGKLLAEWGRSAIGLQRAISWLEAVEFSAGFGLAAWLVFDHLARGGQAGGVLLLIYWALNLPSLGQEIAHLAWQYPSHRNLTLRLMEPLGAPEAEADRTSSHDAAPKGGVAISLEGVTVRAAGHALLELIDLEIASGSHIAIVGPSGAGKSTLVGTLLGWHRPAEGAIFIDGKPLDGQLDALRRATAWVDPSVHIWNRSLLDNVSYGTHDAGTLTVGEVIEAAELREVLQKLPEGLETSLGEGGALVSGGEGQRVRLARAIFRTGTRLAILDEPFRGLDYERRRGLLGRARKLWKKVTLLCITHDVGETLAFDRVLVIEGGRIVEDGAPAALASLDNSRYRAMLDAEQDLRNGFWAGASWRKLRLEGGQVVS